jgi:hypothetical protein
MYILEKLWQSTITWAEQVLVPLVDTIFLYRETSYHHHYNVKGFVRWYSVKSAHWSKWHRVEKDWLDSSPVTVTMCGRRVRKQKTQMATHLPEFHMGPLHLIH